MIFMLPFSSDIRNVVYEQQCCCNEHLRINFLRFCGRKLFSEGAYTPQGGTELSPDLFPVYRGYAFVQLKDSYVIRFKK
jgi:hypothetical protein